MVAAFLNAYRNGEEPVTCELPDGHKVPGTVVEPDRALYGLKDSPLLWYQEFSTALTKFGLIASTEEPCLYYNKERTVMIVFFVNDFLVLHKKITLQKQTS